MTGSEILRALAVGGPAAGMSIQGEWGIAQVWAAERKRVEAFPSGALSEATAKTPNRYLYKEMKLRWTLPSGRVEIFRFWVHDSIKDEIELMRELLSGYRPVILGKEEVL